jgi:hypothetical protein
MFHAAQAMISKKQGPAKFALVAVKLSVKFLLKSQCMSRRSQHCCADPNIAVQNHIGRKNVVLFSVCSEST